MAPPSESDIRKFSDSLKKKNIIFTGNYRRELEARFPKEEDRAHFLDWGNKCAKEARDVEIKRLEALCPTPRELIERIASLDFWDEDARLNLVGILENEVQAPCVLLGRSGGTVYRLIPDTHHLIPSKTLEHEPTEEVLSDSVLSVNTNVEFVRPSQNPGRSRRKINLTDESEKSNDSAEMDNRSEGFIFQQLGELEYSVDLKVTNKTTMQELDQAKWEASGFFVGVEINRSNGRAGPVHIIFDFFPVDDVEGDRFHMDNEHLWGHLPPHKGQIGLAKIAESVRDLGLQHEIQLKDVYNHEPELVPVLRSHTGTFVRSMVSLQ